MRDERLLMRNENLLGICERGCTYLSIPRRQGLIFHQNMKMSAVGDVTSALLVDSAAAL